MAQLVQDGPTTRVFLSYSRKDTAFAVWLRERLEADGIEVYRDIDDTLPSEQWWSRLEQLIGEADTVLFVLSSHSASSTVCAQEVSYAQSLNKRIFPAVIADVDWSLVPPGLAKVHGVYFRADGTQEDAVERLIAALMIDIGWVREHTRLLQRARRWDGRRRPRAELLSGRALGEAESWLAAQPGTAEAPTNLHRLYVQSSRQHASRQQRNRFLGLMAGIIAASAAFGLVVWNQRIAEQKSFQARTLKSLRIVDQAQRLTRQGDTTNALLLGLEVLAADEDAKPSPFGPAARRSLFAAAAKHRLLAVMRPGGPVPSKARMSPDGSKLFLQYQNDQAAGEPARLLSVHKGRLGKSVMPPALQNRLQDLIFSPDGARWVVVMQDGTIRLWDAGGRKEIAVLAHTLRRNHDGPTATFSNDGKCLVTRGALIQIWDPASGKLRVTLPAQFKHWRLSGTGCRVALKTGDHNTIAVWDGIVGKELAVFSVDNQASYSLNATGTLVATADYGGVTLWDVKTAKRLRAFRAHQRRTFSVEFSPVDDNLMVTEGDDGLNLWVDWDRVATTSIGRINGTAPVFTADGKLIVASVNSSQLEVWEFPFVYKYGVEPRRAAVLPGSPGVNSTVLVKHGVQRRNAVLSLYDNGEFRLWSLAQPLQRKRIENSGTLVAISRNRARLVTLDRDESTHRAVIWDARSLKRLHSHKLADGVAESLTNFDARVLQLGPEGKRFLTLSGKDKARTVQVLDVATGKVIIRIAGTLKDAVSASFTPDGARIVTVTPGGRVTIWSAGDGRRLKSFESAVKNIFRAIVTQDQKTVVLATRHGGLYLMVMASGDVSKTLRLWPVDLGKTVRKFDFAEAGGMLAAASGKHFKAFDLRSGKAIVALTADRFIYDRVAVGSGKIALITSDEQLEARIFDIAAGDWVGRLPIAPRGEVGQLAFLSGGNELLMDWRTAHGRDAALMIWRLQPSAKAAASFARQIVPHCFSAAQRRQYQLPPAVPDWCIAMRKPPYDTDAWRQTLAEKRSAGAVLGPAGRSAARSIVPGGGGPAASTLARRPALPSGRWPPDAKRR